MSDDVSDEPTVLPQPGVTPRPLFAMARPGARWPLVIELLLVLVPLAWIIAGWRAQP